MLPTRGEPKLSDRFTRPPGDDRVTLAVLGESSAAGMPYDSWLSIGSIVAWQLGRAIPGKQFRVEMLAQPGDTLDGQYRKLAVLGRRPDALIVYCGHNEIAATIPWWRRVDHYHDDHDSLLWGIEELAGRVSPVCDLIRETAEKYRASEPPAQGVPQPLVDAPAYTQAEFSACLADFRRHLEEIAAYADRIGALTILVVPPSNGADFDPNRSCLPAETPRALRAAFEREFLAAPGRGCRTGEGRRALSKSARMATRLRRDALSSRPPARTFRRLGRGLSTLHRGAGPRRLPDALCNGLPEGLSRHGRAA